MAAATIYAKDLEALTAFYERAFGLERTAEEPGEAVVLDWLTIVQVPAHLAATIETTPRREGTPIKLTFDVPSIADVPVAVDGEPWDWRGHRHADFVDPEGNVGQLRQPV